MMMTQLFGFDEDDDDFDEAAEKKTLSLWMETFWIKASS
jgi:hypothetical protein